ncbi:hypothetical protein POM88_047445 [Heracleum sosnowskyi]|uniref:F-box associated beta-propeller type 1 domain-containing protein n=1 Tax=Heracleum sosnowskyi TaxID=360622 RepID=A0AAD8GTI2_9APIA|nr:hypothetical protein POM88_047445 [Heracleum sosnowskyi]
MGRIKSASEEFVRLNPPPECNISRVNYIKSCNGLVCFAETYYDVIHLLNPSTERFKRIPTPNIQAPCGVYLDFGFDDITNDYKLLRSVFDDVSDDVFKAEVYSANADSWKQIQASEILLSSHIFPNSVLYMERFQKLIPPREVLRLHRLNISRLRLIRKSDVLDFEGSSAVILSDGSVHSVWVLEDVCGVFTWNKKFNLEYNSTIVWVISYLGDGQFVAQNYDLEYISYDYKKKVAKKFLPAADITDYNSVVKYTESLVPLNGFK